MNMKTFAKAIMPSLVSLLASISYSLSQGAIDKQTIIIAAVGLVGSVLTFFVPNAAPEVDALESVFAAPSVYAPASALAPETPAPAPVAPAPPVPPAAA